MDSDTQEADPEAFLVQQPPPANSWGRLVSRHPDQKNVELTCEPFHIGRKQTCDLRFNDQRISGVHCRIKRASVSTSEREETVVFLEDLRYALLRDACFRIFT